MEGAGGPRSYGIATSEYGGRFFGKRGPVPHFQMRIKGGSATRPVIVMRMARKRKRNGASFPTFCGIEDSGANDRDEVL
jgi:hypothetical protein